MNKLNQFAKRFDWTLASILLAFLVISIVAISSAQTSTVYNANFVYLQIRWYVICAGIIGFVMLFEISEYKKMTWYLYALGLLSMLLLVFLPEGEGQIAERMNGAKSWYHTPLGNIQPSEFMKTFFILALAKVVTEHNARFADRDFKSDCVLLAKIIGVLLLPLVFIMLQPDLGTALVFLAITAVIVIVSGITWKIIVPVIIVSGAAGGTLLWMALYMQDFLQDKFGFQPYQFARIYTWLDPYSNASTDSYHLITLLNAIGSGEIFGKGYKARQVLVPESHTDSIFAIIGEEWGFVGGSLVIILYFLLIYHLMKVALLIKDDFSTYIIAGIIAVITFHVLENIGMSIQLLPMTGIPLPFLSYGGSSLMGNALALGLVFSMRYHYHTSMFSTKD